MKKTAAQLQREINEALSARSGLSKHQLDLLSRRSPGGGLRSGYLTPAGWHGDPMVIEDRKLRLEALREQPAPKFPEERSRRSGHATRRRGRHITHQAQHWEGSEIQSLLFDKQWTVPEAKQWAHEHGYKSGKAHVTDNYIRLRQFEPVVGTEKRTITLGQGIKAIIEQVK